MYWAREGTARRKKLKHSESTMNIWSGREGEGGLYENKSPTKAMKKGWWGSL